jgi:hypothetical protein
MPHRNAPLTETGRLRLPRCIVEDGWPLRRAAERFQVSHTTAARWAAGTAWPGGRDGGPVQPTVAQPEPHGAADRAADPRAACLQAAGPARIAYLLGLNPSTVHQVLRRYHCPNRFKMPCARA